MTFFRRILSAWNYFRHPGGRRKRLPASTYATLKADKTRKLRAEVYGKANVDRAAYLAVAEALRQ